MTGGACILAVLRLWWVDPYGDRPVLPDAPPEDGIRTNVLSCSAARGEIESVSFAVRPERDLARVNLTPSPLTGPGGATLPAECADLRVVKVWYRAGGRWGTSWCGDHAKPELVPDLLLHDDGLVRTVESDDPARRTILLRFSEPGGERYVDMRKHGGGERHFQHELHPVYDAPQFVPLDLKANRTQQFWLTFRIPGDAKPGTYRGSFAATEDGRPLADIPVEVTVHPFALPQPRTHYDTSRPFLESWMGVPTLESELRHGKDLARAERKLANVYRSCAEHNCHVPNGFGTFAANSPNDLGVRTLALMRLAGMRCETVINGSAYDAKWCAVHPGDKFTPPEQDPESFAAAKARFVKTLDLHREILDTWLGHHNCYFQSADECGTALNRRSYAFWGLLRERGFEPWTDYGVAEDIGWSVGMNDVPAAARHTTAWNWRRRGGARVVSYAGTFSGPTCPDIWRRKGLRYYYADFDGLHEYCFFYNRWNHWDDFHYRGSYAQMQIVYLTADGLVPTLAWEGVREALDDIRYLSLLRLRAEAAMRSADPRVRQLGRRQLAWMDAQDPEAIVDLFAFRGEIAARICALIREIGPEPDAPQPPAAKPLPPCAFVSRLPADATALERAAEMAKANRYDLAIAAYERIRTATDQPPEARLAAAAARTRLLGETLRRDEALRTIDDTLGQKDQSGRARAKLLLLRVETLMTDSSYAESHTPELLQRAGDTLRLALGQSGTTEEEKFSAILRYLRACRSGGDFARAIAFADQCLAQRKLNDHHRGTILVETAMAERDRGEDAAAARRFRRARKSCRCPRCFPRDVLKEEGALHERLQDWPSALTAYTDELKLYDRVEEKSLIRRCSERIANVMKHIRETDSDAQPESQTPLIELDE